MAGFEIFPELEGYANIAKKKARDGDFWHALEIWQEVGRGVQSRRQQEKDRQQRQSELDAAAKQREKDKADAVDRDLLNVNMDIETDRLKKESEKREKDELAAQNLPKVAEIKAMFRQAVEAGDRKSYMDAIDRYTDLDPEYQKKVPFDLYRDEFTRATTPEKPEKGPSPSEKLAQMELDALMALQDLKKRKLSGDTSVTDEMLAEAIEDLQIIDKSARDKYFERQALGGGEEVPPSMRSPLTKDQRTEATEFDYESRTADMTPAGAGLSSAYALFGVTEVPELNEQFFEPFISPDAKRRKYEFYVSKYATEALNDGTFDDIEDKSERRSAAKQYGIEKVQELFGKPVRGVDRVIDNTPNVESSASIEKTEDEIRRRFPRLNEALQDSTFREALDAEYGEGWSEYFSDSQSTETPESLLEY